MSLRTAIVATLLRHRPALAAADTQRFAGDGFVITATTAEPPVTGSPLAIVVDLTPTGGYKVNEEYPISLELTAPADVTTAKAKLGRGDAKVAASGARFTFQVTPKSAGDKRVGAKLKFALCTDTTCEPRKHAVDLKLDVK
jgi:hypothetical protein